METIKCLICLEEKPLKYFKEFGRNRKINYRKKCFKCRYREHRKLSNKKLFRWKTATKEEKQKHMFEIFEKNTQRQENGCLLWTKKLIKRGYGCTSYDGKNITSHRCSWIIHKGPIPKGMCVLHKCDVPGCVEITHLFLGTPKDNVIDMCQKGRKPIRRGELSNFAKLKEEDVIEIKKLLREKVTQEEIAKSFNVSRGAISDISLKRNWKHVLL